jgi:protein-S-isoprenylcysteine O-methyltransferase Ste14
LVVQPILEFQEEEGGHEIAIEHSGFPIASITIVLCWILFVLFFHNPISQALFILGNVLIGVGILLIILAIATLRRKGNLQEGENFTATTVVVKHGVYSVVRHDHHEPA